MYDEPLQECKDCPDHVDKAEDDRAKFNGKETEETCSIQHRHGPRHLGGPQDGDAAGGKAAARRYR